MPVCASVTGGSDVNCNFWESSRGEHFCPWTLSLVAVVVFVYASITANEHHALLARVAGSWRSGATAAVQRAVG